jgi:hypothetical protein
MRDLLDDLRPELAGQQLVGVAAGLRVRVVDMGSVGGGCDGDGRRASG